MNEFDILKELEKLNDDSEPGFLSELQQQAPDELHSRVMNSIRAEIRPRNRFNYRKYASFATAAAVLVFALMGGAKSLFDNNNLANTKNLTEFTESNAKKVIVNEKVALNDVKAFKVSPKTNSNTNPVISEKAKPKQKTMVAYGPSNGSKAKISKKQDVSKVNTASAMKIAIASEPKAKKIPDTSKEVAIASVDRKDPISTNLSSENTQNPSDIVDNSVQTNQTEASSKTLTSASLAPDNLVTGFRVASLSLDSIVNYEISLNMGQTYIIQFIKEKGVKLSEEIYKLDKEDFDMLNQILDQSGIAKNKVNDLDNQYVIIKMIMN